MMPPRGRPPLPPRRRPRPPPFDPPPDPPARPLPRWLLAAFLEEPVPFDAPAFDAPAFDAPAFVEPARCARAALSGRLAVSSGA